MHGDGADLGVDSTMARWIYEAITIPSRLTFGAGIWWRTANLTTVKTILDGIQGIALRRIYGAMKTAPI